MYDHLKKPHRYTLDGEATQRIHNQTKNDKTSKAHANTL